MSAEILNKLVKTATAAHPSQPVKVFLDLDSTLFTVRHRTQALLRKFAVEHSRQFPRQAASLEAVEVLDTDWGIRSALLRSGIAFDAEFAEQIRRYWQTGFFSSDYLHLDEPYPGAVDFVNRLKAAGAHVHYLTGRDRPRMGAGTEQSLRAHGFPLDLPLEQLLMKPQPDHSDIDFKESVFRKLDGIFREVWFFENEPLIINRLIEAKMRVNCVFVDSVHSGRALPPQGIPTVKPDFRLA
jgi:hypothetical protein